MCVGVVKELLYFIFYFFGLDDCPISWTLSVCKMFYSQNMRWKRYRYTPFSPDEVPFPKLTVNKFIRQSATDIIHILTSPPSPTAMSLEGGDETINTLLKLAEVLQRTGKNHHYNLHNHHLNRWRSLRLRGCKRIKTSLYLRGCLQQPKAEHGKKVSYQCRKKCYNLHSNTGNNFKSMPADVLLA